MANFQQTLFRRPVCLIKLLNDLWKRDPLRQLTCRSVASYCFFTGISTRPASLFSLSSSSIGPYHPLRQWERLSSSLIPSLHPSNSSAVIDAVESEIAQGQERLFAVISIAGLQHKVTTGDLILLQCHIAADVGERIRLEKVLLIGGNAFTLIGKPLLSLDSVRIEATVIEKTISEKKVIFQFKRRKRVANYKERYTNLSVLRINSIEVSPKLT